MPPLTALWFPSAGRRWRPLRALRWVAPLAVSLLVGCAERQPERSELVVSAASSLSGVMRELADGYRRQHPGVVVRNNFGASGVLEQQIRRGAGVDLFISAADREVEALAADGLVRAETRRVLAHNRLVLVVPAATESRVRGFRDLAVPEVRRIAIGDPSAVPAGVYARAVLESLGLWPRVVDRVVFTANVRQALTYVERGEVDAALVYRTDALGNDRVQVVDTAAAHLHPPINYSAVVAAGARDAAEARRYLEFLSSPVAAEVFRRRGFVLPDSLTGA